MWVSNEYYVADGREKDAEAKENARLWPCLATLPVLYKSLVKPVLEYGNLMIIWGTFYIHKWVHEGSENKQVTEVASKVVK